MSSKAAEPGDPSFLPFSDSDKAAQCTLLSDTLCPGHLAFSSCWECQEPDGFLFFLPRLSCELKCVGLQPLPSPGAEGCGPCPHPCYILAMSLQGSFLGV